MLMTTTLLTSYMIYKRYNPIFILFTLVIYVTIESAFLIANLSKFTHGGWITLLIASILITVMLVWNYAREIRNRFIEFVKLSINLPLLEDLSKDLSVPKYATHLVYLTGATNQDEIESKIIYSIFQKQPKRADIYWFVHVDVVDEPYLMEYKVHEFVHDDVIRIDFRLGFRVEPKINLMFRKVVEDLVDNNEVDIRSRYSSLNKNNIIGDFKFIVIEKVISYENELPFYEELVLDAYDFLKHLSLSEEKAFGLDTSSVTIESVPMIIAPPKELRIKRVYD